MGLIEHEVPEHGLVRLLELRREGLEVVEVQVETDSPSRRQDGRRAGAARRLATHLRDANGQAQIAIGSTVLGAGDQVLAILQPGKEDELRRALIRA